MNSLLEEVFDDLSSVVIELISFSSELIYFPGGSISVLFEPKGVLPLDNVFQLELSDASGSFASPIVIASAEEFFTPILNGKIPLGTPVGNGYKLRISYGPENGPRFFTELPDSIEIGTIDAPFSIPFIVIGSTAQRVNLLSFWYADSSIYLGYHFSSIKQSRFGFKIKFKV